MFRIGVDVMSGDSDSSLLIKGCLDALKKCESQLMLVGNPDIIERTLRVRIYPRKRVKIIESDSVIGMNEHPGIACRNKKTSSVMIGLKSLKEKSIDAFFSPGNTGATLAGSLYTIGRMKNVKRPGIGVFLPTEKGFTLMIDAGANMDCHYKYLKQFAIMGHTYIKHFLEIKNVRVGLLNVGEESHKGNDLTLKTYKNLEKLSYNFVGNMEPKDIIKGDCDLVICDGFSGNILLKSMESISKFFFKALQEIAKENLVQSLLFLGLKNRLIAFKKGWDPDEVGSAPLLGVAKPVFIGHGSTDRKSINSAIVQIENCLKKNVFHKIEEQMHVLG